jgi:hypothetical protein
MYTANFVILLLKYVKGRERQTKDILKTVRRKWKNIFIVHCCAYITLNLNYHTSVLKFCANRLFWMHFMAAF